MLHISLKETSTASFRTPLGKYIKSKYSEQSDKFDEDLKVLDDLRMEATSAEVSLSAVNRIWKYTFVY